MTGMILRATLWLLVLAALIIFAGRAIRADEVIKRNAIWNEMVVIIRCDNDKFMNVQKFLKDNEKKGQLDYIDIRTLKDIEDLENDHKELAKLLKELRKEVKQ